MKNIVNGVQWVNILTLLAQLLNDFSGAFPALQSNHYVLAAQGMLGVLLPSLNGWGHQAVFGTAQDAGAKK